MLAQVNRSGVRGPGWQTLYRQSTDVAACINISIAIANELESLWKVCGAEWWKLSHSERRFSNIEQLLSEVHGHVIITSGVSKRVAWCAARRVVRKSPNQDTSPLSGLIAWELDMALVTLQRSPISLRGYVFMPSHETVPLCTRRIWEVCELLALRGQRLVAEAWQSHLRLGYWLPGESDDIKQMTLKVSNDTTQGKWSYLPPNTPRITWWGKCVAMNTLEMQTLIWINQKRLQRNDQVSLRWKNRYKRKKQRNCITHKIKGVDTGWSFSEESI